MSKCPVCGSREVLSEDTKSKPIIDNYQDGTYLIISDKGTQTRFTGHPVIQFFASENKEIGRLEVCKNCGVAYNVLVNNDKQETLIEKKKYKFIQSK